MGGRGEGEGAWSIEQKPKSRAELCCGSRCGHGASRGLMVLGMGGEGGEEKRGRREGRRVN